MKTLHDSIERLLTLSGISIESGWTIEDQSLPRKLNEVADRMQELYDGAELKKRVDMIADLRRNRDELLNSNSDLRGELGKAQKTAQAYREECHRLIAEKLGIESPAKYSCTVQEVGGVKHTPGPWSVRNNYGVCIVDSDGTSICEIYDNPDSGAEEPGSEPSTFNAQLIAAAPDLLEACELALSQVKTMGATLSDSLQLELKLKQALEKVKQ